MALLCLALGFPVSAQAPAGNVGLPGGAWVEAGVGDRPIYGLVFPETGRFRFFTVKKGMALAGAFAEGEQGVGGVCTGFSLSHPKVQPWEVAATRRLETLNLAFRGPAGAFDLDLEPDPEANLPVSLELLPGTYHAADRSGVRLLVSPAPPGGATATMTGKNPAGGVFLGTLTQLGPGLNAFSAAFTFTPAQGGRVRTFQGLFYLRRTVPVQGILMADDGEEPFCAVFEKPGK